MVTLCFICGAFLAYAILSRWVVAVDRRFHLKRGRRSGRHVLTAGGGLALAIFVWLSLCPAERCTQLHLGRFLGMVWADEVNFTPVSFDDLMQPLATISNDQPPYTYLHPDSPANQLATSRHPRKKRPSRDGSPKKSFQAKK